MTFDEWFHKEYEPADIQIKQYAENKEGLHIPAMVYLEDLKKAFEAGQKGKVVEHFEAYGQCRDSRMIAELEKENVELIGKVAFLENDLNNAKAQIEKMKRCSICKYSTDLGYCKIRCNGGECNKMDKWEIKENE